MTASSYAPIVITLAPSTLNALTSGGYSLYASCAVMMDNASALPTVWLATQSLFPTTTVPVIRDVSAYTSPTPIANGNIITVGGTTAIALGQTWEVGAGGTGSVKKQGPADKITVNNNTAGPFTSGLSRAVSAGAAGIPVFAVPLYGHQINQVSPVAQVLLQFSTARMAAGQVIGQTSTAMKKALATSGGYLLVELSDSDQRDLAFDINTGWDWGAAVWGTSVPAGSDLTKILIQPETAG